MKGKLLILVAIASLVMAGNAGAQTRHEQALQRLTVRLDHAKDAVRFFENRGQWLRATRKEKCAQVPWQKSCRIARAIYAERKLEVVTLKRKVYLHLPSSNDWLTSVKIAQRVNPGTDRFLYSCSGGEGGHGGFVYNTEGSGAAGWMQFMPTTFYGHVDVAFAHARGLGFKLPDGIRDIRSPLGQALVASYMRSHGMSSHWDPRIDPACA